MTRLCTICIVWLTLFLYLLILRGLLVRRAKLFYIPMDCNLIYLRAQLLALLSRAKLSVDCLELVTAEESLTRSILKLADRAHK